MLTEMDAHLVGTSGFEAACDEGKTAGASCQNFIVGDGAFEGSVRIMGSRARCEFDALCGVAAIGRVEGSLIRKVGGMAYCPVLTVDCVLREQIHEKGISTL